jgi:hypothetical protein
LAPKDQHRVAVQGLRDLAERFLIDWIAQIDA